SGNEVRSTLERSGERPGRRRWFRKQSAVKTTVSRRPWSTRDASALFFIGLREMRSTVWRGRNMSARRDGLFRWLAVWAEHISLLTDREGSLRFDPFRHPLMDVERSCGSVWRETCN